MTPLRTLLASLFLATAALAGDLRTAKIFGDHMVFQRETNAPIWGWDSPGTEVRITASWNGETVTAKAGADGRWQATLDTPAAGGPHEVTIVGSDTIKLSDVLCGEVWIGSGQSNMEWGVRISDNPEQEIAAANHPRIRIFDVARKIALSPEADVQGAWSAVTPQSIPNFSAVAYYFGRELQQELDVPVGLIGTNWGGTVVEAWTSNEAVARHEEFKPTLDRIAKATAGGGDESSVNQLKARWWKNVETSDPGFQRAWMRELEQPKRWKDVTVPSLFKDFGMGDFDGCMWYRRTIEIPEQWKGRDLVLDLGPIDDLDKCWFNGKLVGETLDMGKWSSPRHYSVPAKHVRSGENQLTILCIDTGGAGAIGLNTTMMVRPVDANNGEAVTLAGTWKVRQGVKASTLGSFPSSNWFHANVATALFNGMVAPLVPFAFRGVLWYQGESNRGRALQYRELFPTMIADWREQWDRGSFPFLFVQIAPYNYGGDRGEAAELREAQTLTLGVPNTGMAVTMDIGNPGDIHPRNKQEVGRRLALWALSRTYGRTGIGYSGPLYRAAAPTDGALRLSFAHGKGLKTSDGEAPSHFQVAGADRVFHPATATIDGEMIVVRSEAVAQPVAARYAWGAADEPNVVNADGLPAPSFRTDDWPAVSSGR